MSVGIYLSIYVCHAMDPGNPEVTMLKEPISHLHFLAHCDVIEQPAKTDTLTISDHKGFKASFSKHFHTRAISVKSRKSEKRKECTTLRGIVGYDTPVSRI